MTWNPYTCDNSEKIQIWRRVGSFDFTPSECEVGIPDGSGYILVGEVDGDQILFDDTNNGEGLAPGSKYCYRILAEFPLPEGGTSYVSDEVCVGRIRTSNSNQNFWISCWIVADNVFGKGAALNAIQILEEMIKRKL